MEEVVMQEKVERAFKEGDIEELKRLSVQAWNTSSRAHQLLGDLYRQAKQFQLAEHAYERSAPDNMSAIYGQIECWRNLNEKEPFMRAIEKFLSLGRYNEALFARIALASAEMGNVNIAQDLLTRIDQEGPLTNNAYSAFRCAKALVLLGERERAGEYIDQARKNAGDDENLHLEIATLDYDIDEYWEMRYNTSQGERTPVRVEDQSDEAYRQRTELDCSFLDMVFDKLFGKTIFASAADCGCGSGRLTPFLLTKSETLHSYDASPTAIEFARKNNPNLPRDAFNAANLSKVPLSSNTYDLVFDFTAIQHVSDPVLWGRVFENYIQSLKPRAHLFLVESCGDDLDRSEGHMNSASSETYIRMAKSLGCTLIYSEPRTGSDDGAMCMVFLKN